MCKWNPKSVIYLSFLWWRHHESYPVSCAEFAPRLRFEVFLLVDHSNVCLFTPDSGRPYTTHQHLHQFLQVSVQWASTAWVWSCCPQPGRSEGFGSSLATPLHIGTDSLMAHIKLSLDFMCLLSNKFILDQTDSPAYAQDKMFKWCKVGFSNYDPEHFFFPYPLTCNLKINTQAPPGCDNFSKQNWK